MKQSKQLIFLTIVFAQFCGTSLWFAGNASLSSLQSGWPEGVIGYVTVAVQIGFIAGTLLFALTGVVDKYSPSWIFLLSCIAGSLCNSLILLQIRSFPLVIISRVMTGLCLAGIYPVGMKIASDWQEKGLGNWLGALVGALVLGTAFPHGLKMIPGFIEAERLLIGVSVLAILGGVSMVIFVPGGPFRKKSTAFSFASVREAFRIPQFRSPALGYFGHMWELYAFWAFLPWAAIHYKSYHPELSIPDSWFAFLFIAIGAFGCWIGGRLSFRIGSDRVALYALVCSGLCCLISPWIWSIPPSLFFPIMFFWGFMVTADSPQFSTLVARSAPESIRGSAITLVTCIGFSITIVSIQMLNLLKDFLGDYLLFTLAPGPVIGVFMILKSGPKKAGFEHAENHGPKPTNL